MINGIASAIPAIGFPPDSFTSGTAGVTAPPSFADTFEAAIHSVDTLQNGADGQISSLLHGAANGDAGKTVVSVEKADIAFQLMMQVRNKVVSAYQEIEKMQF